jgi:hypothetical protein
MTYRRREPSLMHVGHLTADVLTPFGIHPSGSSVIVLDTGATYARICLDGGLHLTGRCHTTRIPTTWLDHDPRQAAHLRSTAA